MSLSPLGRCHPHPLVPTEAPQHPDHPRAHGGAARGLPHLGWQGQVQQEECPGGEQVTAGGALVTPQGPHMGHRTMPHLPSSSQQWCRQWKWGHWGCARVGGSTVTLHCRSLSCSDGHGEVTKGHPDSQRGFAQGGAPAPRQTAPAAVIGVGAGLSHILVPKSEWLRQPCALSLTFACCSGSCGRGRVRNSSSSTTRNRSSPPGTRPLPTASAGG